MEAPDKLEPQRPEEKTTGSLRDPNGSGPLKRVVDGYICDPDPGYEACDNPGYATANEGGYTLPEETSGPPRLYDPKEDYKLPM